MRHTLFLFVLVLFMAADVRATSTTWTVTKTADTNDGVCDADCSFREALDNASPVFTDTIVFSSLFNTPQTITLAGHALEIGTNLIINGPGADLLTISANNLSNVFEISGPTSLMTLSGMTITGGSGDGIEVNSAFDLQIKECIITENGSNGIENSDFTRVYDSTISANGASGIDNSFGDMEIQRTTITGNAGTRAGGIYNTGGELNLIKSTVSNNTGNSFYDVHAGGIYNSGTLIVTNSTISGNAAVGGDFNAGGIYEDSDGTAFIRDCTITNNSADGANSAGGIYSEGLFDPVVEDTIIAANVNNSVIADVVGGFTSDGYNLIGNVGLATGFTNTGDQTGSGASPIDPRLDPLDNYGGPTETHRLQVSPIVSPAIDKGSSGTSEDQREYIRPHNKVSIPPAPGGDDSDIGAYELHFFVSIGGRAISSDGKGIKNVLIRIIGPSGEARFQKTNRFGLYRFEKIPRNRTYNVTATYRNFEFEAQIVNVTEETITDLDFVAMP
ncbi:right-handed parallel beta-helix repeat-containing protein [bacterium]|nr:right-handed parallel beta-helix repeat-containing protein [bacterium]